jgi:hypothetical protein
VRCTEPRLFQRDALPIAGPTFGVIARPMAARPQRLTLLALAVATALLAGCGVTTAPVQPAAGAAAPAGAARGTQADGAARAPALGSQSGQGGQFSQSGQAGQAGARLPAVAPLQPLPRARNWDEFRLLAARRMVALNPDQVYHGPVPEPLLAIPVLEVELNADGSVRHIAVTRQPSQARDTVALAMAAIKRAAPFSAVAHLPRPWKFTEVFLFDDERRFKPRSLDL